MKHLILGSLLAFVVSAAFTGCTTTQESTATSVEAATFQIRLVTDAPSGDSSALSVVQGPGKAARDEVLHVQNAILLDQTAVKTAKLQTDSLGHPQIAIAFTENGARRFAEVTRESIGKRLAIVIDGQLYSAPMIMMEIPGGKANISGSFSEQEAKELVEKINASLK